MSDGNSHGRFATARRIVSLVPSTTESLAALGLAARVVGRTRWCVHPRPWVDEVPVMGGTKDPDLAAIASARPDLVLVNEEENRPEDIEALRAIAPLRSSFPRTVHEALADLASLAVDLGVGPAGEDLLGAIGNARAEARVLLERDAIGRDPAQRPPRRRVACLVWRKPWRALGGPTYGSSLLAELGCDNVLAGHPARYPAIGLGSLLAADPELVLLPDEPYPFHAGHASELGRLAPRARLVDGTALFWHGARMASAFPALARQLRA